MPSIISTFGRRTQVERLAHPLLETHARLTIVEDAEECAFTLPFTQEIMSDALGLSDLCGCSSRKPNRGKYED
jgi:hypothetical protein